MDAAEENAARVTPIPRRSVFPWGIASGDPTFDEVTLWTRLDVDAASEVRWTMWTDTTGDHEPDRAGVGDCDDGGFVHVRVGGLTAGTQYRYRFEWNGTTSPTGRTRTLRPDASTVRLGIACCARLASGPLTPYSGLRVHDPDLVVHLGDYIYEDGPDPAHDSTDAGSAPLPPTVCRTTDDYMARYAQYRSDRHLGELHAAAPWVLTPDDHEVTDNAAADRAADGAETTPDHDRLAAALTTHGRWMPQALHGDGPSRFDRHVALGSVGDLVMIDTRLAGREAQAADDATAEPSRKDASGPDHRRLLTDAQWTWLDDLAAGHRRGWLIIASQVQVSPLRLGWRPVLSWPPRLEPIVNPDQWDGYPTERERLIELLDRHEIDDVVLISGDLHGRFVTSTSRHSRSGHVVEVTTPSVSAPTFADLIGRRLPLPTRWRAWRLAARWLRLANPHIVRMDLEHHGTTVLDVDVDAVHVHAIAPTGDIVDRFTVHSIR